MVIFSQALTLPDSGVDDGNGASEARDVSTYSTKTVFVDGDSDGDFQVEIASAEEPTDDDYYPVGGSISGSGFVTINDLAKWLRVTVSSQSADKSPSARVLGLYAAEGG